MKSLKHLAAGCCLLFVFVLGARAQDYPAGQLPQGVTPTHYKLDLNVQPKREDFSGRVIIDVALTAPTQRLWLHGQDLNVSAAVVIDQGGERIAATWTEIPDSDGVARLDLASSISGPAVQIDITYDAPFNRQLEGLYRADENGQSYAYSQMETIFARRAFPSFDEPRFKTPFDIAMTVPATDTAVSNAPVVKEEAVSGDLKKVTFATTKPLPTYLVALLAGPFDVVEGPAIPQSAVRDRAIPLRGITAKGKGAQIKYALDNTPGILEALETYFGTPYPYEKLDIIAVTDFAYGAMENAGAITYREQLLLIDENSPLSQKRSYALVHAHELAHQWFGNLVTPVWWNDIWLNEAFATWMGNKAVAAWDPAGEYGRLTLSDALDAMGADSSHAARAIAQPILSNDDIQNAFDSITYEKGGGVLAMFEQFYGPENFQKGVALYMERKALGVATAKEFLQAVADANQDTEGVAAFESFLNQPGVPLITARLTCSSGASHLEIAQSRYLREAAPANAAAQTWAIPMCVAYGGGFEREQMCVIVKEQETRLALESPGCPAWVMPNADGAGYYRFSFDDAGWESLARASGSLSEKEVLALLDSMDAAFAVREMNFDSYLARLRTIVALRTQRNGFTWDAAQAVLSRLAWFDRVLVPDAQRPQLAAVVRELYGTIYGELGLDPTSARDKTNPVQSTLMRSPVVEAIAMYARAPDVRADLAARGAAYIGDGEDGEVHPEAVIPDLLDEALEVAVQDRGLPFVTAVLSHLENERNGFIRQRLLSALTRSTDPAIAEQVRNLALSDNLRVNEIPNILYGMMSQRANRAAAWDWFKSNFDALKTRTPPNNRAGLVGVGAYFCSADERADYEKFFASRIDDITGAPRSFASMIEQIKSCTALVESQRPIAVKTLNAM